MMTPVFFAGVNRDNAIRELIPSTSSVAGTFVLVGALFLVVLVVFALAVFFRPQRRHRHSHRSRKPAPTAVSENAHGKKSSWHSRRKHHRQPENLPRNPTLAEAGGLPPVRTGERSSPPGLVD
jgi:hypothetical protein